MIAGPLHLELGYPAPLAPAHYVVYYIYGMTTDDAQRRWALLLALNRVRFWSGSQVLSASRWPAHFTWNSATPPRSHQLTMWSATYAAWPQTTRSGGGGCGCWSSAGGSGSCAGVGPLSALIGSCQPSPVACYNRSALNADGPYRIADEEAVTPHAISPAAALCSGLGQGQTMWDIRYSAYCLGVRLPIMVRSLSAFRKLSEDVRKRKISPVKVSLTTANQMSALVCSAGLGGACVEVEVVVLAGLVVHLG